MWYCWNKDREYTVELQWFKHLWNRENMLETGVDRANIISANYSARSEGITRMYFYFLYHESMLCILIRIPSSRRF